MTTEQSLEYRVKECIINRLDLEVTPDEIVNEAPLFGEGLGLDSLDSLELVIALGKEFDVIIGDDEYEVLDTVNSICEFLRAKNSQLV